MKSLNRISFLLSGLLIALGITLLRLHQDICYFTIALGASCLVLTALRVLVQARMKHTRGYDMFWTYLGILLFINGLLFKLLRFSPANFQIVLGMGIIFFQVLPTLFIRQLEDSKLKELQGSRLEELADQINALKVAGISQTGEKKNADRAEEAGKLETLSVPTMQGLEFIPIGSISHLEADDKYTKVFLHSNKMMLASRTLGAFEELLSASGFVRIHHSYLINTSQLKNYIKGEGGQVVMNNGTVLDVSRRRKHELMEVVRSSNTIAK